MASPRVIFAKHLEQFREVVYSKHLRHFFRDRNRKSLFSRPRVAMSEYDENFSSAGDNSINEIKSFSAPEEMFSAPRLIRRQSTMQDEQRMIFLLKEILEDQMKNMSAWLVENKVRALCFNYKNLLVIHKEGFLKALAAKYAIDHMRVYHTARQFRDFEPGSNLMLKAEEQLRQMLTPQYTWLFKIIGRLENGVKFLVDLRSDIYLLIQHTDTSDPVLVHLLQLNNSLRDLLSMWFSVGFLKVERITWQSSCEMLQKISEYEAVHPVRNWPDIKRRVGLYRRCYVFTHRSMPQEPIVVLHTALTNEISTSITGIVTSTQRLSSVESLDGAMGMFGTTEQGTEDPSLIRAAIFYSISSTQRGLYGIELGNYLIKSAVREVQAELPHVTIFSSLSPIPLFRIWLMEKIRIMETGVPDPAIDLNLWAHILNHFHNNWAEVKKALYTNLWHNDDHLAAMLEEPLMRTCAYFLYYEKSKSNAHDAVANFHLRNGAVMWRINWLADTTPRGMNLACGMMVNYRYFLDDLESNSREYLENGRITASEQIMELLGPREPRV